MPDINHKSLLIGVKNLAAQTIMVGFSHFSDRRHEPGGSGVDLESREMRPFVAARCLLASNFRARSLTLVVACLNPEP
jgi:hypothetical protein